jgi:hypothetical protein
MKLKRRFGGTYRLHIQGQILSPTRKDHEVVSRLSFFRLNGFVLEKIDLYICSKGLLQYKWEVNLRLLY